MTDQWTDPADALFTNPDWEDPFPDEELEWCASDMGGPEYWMAFDEVFYGVFEMDGSWASTDFYAPRARFVSDR